jgi:hypothetical protein
MATMFGIGEYEIQIFQMIAIFEMISGAVMLAFGIIGVKCCNKSEKVNLLIVIGIVNIVVTVFTTLYNYTLVPVQMAITQQVLEAVQGAGSRFANSNIGGLAGNPTSMAISFILPALFLAGALLNRMPPKPVYPSYMPPPQQDDTLLAQQLPDSGLADQEDLTN